MSLIRPDFNPWSILASIAASHVGEREQTPNRSPFILRLWRETWDDGGEYYEGREPWCAAFVCWCLKQALAANARLAKPCEFSPSVHILRESLLSRSIPSRNKATRIVGWRDARKGDIITFLPVFSHVGIVEECVPGGLITIEGNTNGSGARDGDGVYRKQREASLVARCDVWRLPLNPPPENS